MTFRLDQWGVVISSQIKLTQSSNTHYYGNRDDNKNTNDYYTTRSLNEIAKISHDLYVSRMR